MSIPYPIRQAPMVGFTDLAFRRICRRFGCGLAFAEMVKDRPVVDGNERTLAMVGAPEWDHPLGVQLLGREPATLADAARRLEQMGADLIDLNLGCPVNKVISGGCGSALLKEPHQVGLILARMVPAVRIPVTIKMRTGFDEGDDQRFLDVARIASKCGVAAITVHGRTRRQGFRGLSNHDAIRLVKEVSSVPVIGNGDIRCGADAVRMVRETGCEGVMLARGALGNPWIYREVEASLSSNRPLPCPTPAERAAVLSEHFQYLREFNGDRIALTKVRRVIHCYIYGVPGAMQLRERGNRVDSLEGFEEIVTGFAGSSETCLLEGVADGEQRSNRGAVPQEAPGR